MNLRHIPPEMDATSVAAIDVLLGRVVNEQGVHVPLAIESGSRAWGFSSPDSDYDCRFIYVRPAVRHLTPWPERDVIEFPPQGDLDANGWDFAKALRLLIKGNAVVIEWLRSPVIYQGETWFRDAFLEFAHETAARQAIGRHYLHLGERQRRTYFGDGTEVPQKKIFYALRPAATLRWLRLRPAEAIAPMHFPTLMAECDPPVSLSAEVAELMVAKAQTRELRAAPLSPTIATFIDEEFAKARTVFETGPVRISESKVRRAAKFYREVVERLDGATEKLAR
jgi:predicted nucleotidyltransferase